MLEYQSVVICGISSRENRLQQKLPSRDQNNQGSVKLELRMKDAGEER